MRKVAVVGCGGSGKSTLARELAERTGLPLIHLDREYWRAGWTPTPSEEWTARHEELLSGDRWIADGNFNSTQEQRFARADTILFLDFPRWLCTLRIHKRWIRYWRRTRPDLAPGCHERFDRDFARWVWNFPRDVRPAMLERVARFREGRRVEILRNPREVRRFLETL